MKGIRSPLTCQSDKMYYMAYFRDTVPDLYLAKSDDLLHWEDVNGGKALYTPTNPDRIIRDPYILQDCSGLWHVFFTNNWYSQTIGHVTSTDLKTFTEEPEIVLFPDNPDVYNCWAPECVYDEIKDRYLLIWTTSFRSQNSENEDSNRIWCAESTDLYHFDKPNLFFDPGYPVIDASVVKVSDTYHMVFKDERDFNAPGTPYSALRTATAQSLKGPYNHISDILTAWRTEGPMLLYVEDEFYVFYDSFGDGTYKGMKSKDFSSWEDISSEMDFPKGCRHLSIVAARDA